MNKYRILIGSILIAVTVGLTVAGIYLLPPNVGMQIGTGGALQNFMPKWLAILLPAALGCGSAAAYMCKVGKAFALVSAVLIVVQIVTLILN